MGSEVDAGYSGTPLPKKLGVTAHTRVKITNAPDSFEPRIQPFTTADDDLDIAIAFCRTIADLEEAFELRRDIRPAGAIWIAWPKKTSTIATELTENTLRDLGLPLGIVDNKVCAIDEHWSGLRFVWRKELRANLPL